MANFRDLAAGRVGSVDVFVFAGSTNAKRRVSGIYEMNKSEFDAIASERIANGDRVGNMDEFLEALADGAMGDRWLRLSDVVSDWIDSKPPKLAVEESIF